MYTFVLIKPTGETTSGAIVKWKETTINFKWELCIAKELAGYFTS